MCPHCLLGAIVAFIFGLPLIGGLILWIKTKISTKNCDCKCHHQLASRLDYAGDYVIEVECDRNDHNPLLVHPITPKDLIKLIKGSGLTLKDLNYCISDFPIKQLGVYKFKHIKVWIVRK